MAVDQNSAVAVDRGKFTRTILLQALQVSKTACHNVAKCLDRHLLDMPRLRHIVGDSSNPDARLVLLKESYSTADLGSLLAAKREELAPYGPIQLAQYELVLDYSYWPADHVLRELLPAGSEVPTSFETIGHVAHVNIRDELLPYKHLIGQVLLEKNAPRIRTVVNKVGTIENQLRVPTLEVLAGDPSLRTEVRQHGAAFRLDYGRVYWNSRLEHEHARLCALFRPRQVVLDLFAGVGPFAVPAARSRRCCVFANDLNPDSVRYLRENAAANRVAAAVHAFNLDALAFVRAVTRAPPAPALAPTPPPPHPPLPEDAICADAASPAPNPAAPAAGVEGDDQVMGGGCEAREGEGERGGDGEGERGGRGEGGSEGPHRQVPGGNLSGRNAPGLAEAGPHGGLELVGGNSSVVAAAVAAAAAAAAAGVSEVVLQPCENESESQCAAQRGQPVGTAAASAEALPQAAAAVQAAAEGAAGAHTDGAAEEGGGEKDAEKRRKKRKGKAGGGSGASKGGGLGAAAAEQGQVVEEEAVQGRPWEHFDHAVMNLPASAIEFLGVFKGLLSRATWRGSMPLIHCYTFMRSTETHADVIRNSAVAVDRGKFTRTILLQALQVSKTACHNVAKCLDRHLLDMPRLRHIVGDSSNPDARLVLLKESYSTADLGSLLAAKREELAPYGPIQLAQYELVLDYSYWPADHVLRELLPAGSEVPTSFETIGHVAHVNIRDELLPYKHLIGQVLLEKNAPRIRTVVNKVGTIENQLRVPTLEVLAGDPSLRTEVRQHGAAFRLDYGRVYWNSRLEHEHARLCALFRPRQVVLDLFAGVGPFAVPAARSRRCCVFANDLNPDSVRYLRENAAANRVAAAVHAFNLDALAFVRAVTRAPPAPALAPTPPPPHPPLPEDAICADAASPAPNPAAPAAGVEGDDQVMGGGCEAREGEGERGGDGEGERGGRGEGGSEGPHRQVPGGNLSGRNAPGLAEAGPHGGLELVGGNSSVVAAAVAAAAAAAAAGVSEVVLQPCENESESQCAAQRGQPVGTAAASAEALPQAAAAVQAAAEGAAGAHTDGAAEEGGGEKDAEKRRKKRKGKAGGGSGASKGGGLGAAAAEQGQVVEEEAVQGRPWEHFDHAVMNLPASAIEFLGVFKGLLSRATWRGSMPLIHCYTFMRSTETHADVIRKAEGYLGGAIQAPSVWTVRDVAPNKYFVSSGWAIAQMAAWGPGGWRLGVVTVGEMAAYQAAKASCPSRAALMLHGLGSGRRGKPRVFKGLLSRATWRGSMPLIHCYTFMRSTETHADVIRKAEGYLGGAIQAPSVWTVRDVAPNKYFVSSGWAIAQMAAWGPGGWRLGVVTVGEMAIMLCLSFELPEAVAFASCASANASAESPPVETEAAAAAAAAAVAPLSAAPDEALREEAQQGSPGPAAASSGSLKKVRTS
eukprot:jgi/Mesen1/3993/ME000210S03233